MKKLPKHFEQTLRDYKRQKRKEFKVARNALNNLRSGCAYLPPSAYNQLCQAKKSFEKAYEDCKPWWKKA